MSTFQSQPLPSTRRLLKATALAIIVAGILLVTTVLPAEYGIDPTGLGARLGLDALGATAQAAEIEAPAAVQVSTAQSPQAGDIAEAVKAGKAFGASDGQSFDTAAVVKRSVPYRQDTLEVILPPGKGAEVKALLKAGDGLVFTWKATGDVALDMHGERAGVKNAWTSYSVESAQREGSGTFIAPFDGSHGWYWQNRGETPVTVQVQVAGFQEKLYRPGKS
jgi:hypothetical protein